LRRRSLLRWRSANISNRPTKTVSELADEWQQKRVDCATFTRGTLMQHRNHIEHFIKPELGSIRVDAVTISIVEKAAAAWAERPRMSPKTSNKVLTTLTGIFAMAKRYDLRRDNPAQDALRLKVATKDDHGSSVVPDMVYTKDEIGKLIEATEPGSRESSLVMTLAFTGLRIGELLALDWDHVDLKEGKLSVRFSLADSDSNEEPLFQVPKTPESKRTIPLPQELVTQLRLWRMCCQRSERKLVFATEEGQPYSRKAMTLILTRVINKAGVKRLTPHGFRHTFASLLLADKVPIPEVSHLMGHKNPQVTLTVYSHFVRQETGAVQNLAASILGSGK